MLHEGDYIAEDGIHQTKGTITLTGTENWSKSQTLNRYYIDAPTNSQSPINGGRNVICSNCQRTNSITETGIFLNDATFDSERKLLVIISRISTVESWKMYLAQSASNGTPVTVEYELEEEIVTTFTEEQQKAYDKLRLMYEGYNKITCTDNIKPDMIITYYYDNDLNKLYAKRIDMLEKKTIEDIKSRTNILQRQFTSSYIENIHEGLLITLENANLCKMMFIKIHAINPVGSSIETIIQAYQYDSIGNFLYLKQKNISGNLGACSIGVINNKVVIWIPKLTDFCVYFVETCEYSTTGKSNKINQHIATEYTSKPEIEKEKVFTSNNIVIGTEIETGRIIGGKNEYMKRLATGNLTSGGEKTISTGLTNITQQRPATGIVQATGQANIDIPNSTNSIRIYTRLSSNGASLTIGNAGDLTAFSGFVDLYYTKN